MAEKFTYGPLIYNCFGEDDDSGNYWWAGNPPVAYEQESGPFRIPVDADGNQCLPGESILHPNCRVEVFEEIEDFSFPSLAWCREWFEDNFLEVDDALICRYILRWMNNEYKNSQRWIDFRKQFNDIESMSKAIWPDVIT